MVTELDMDAALVFVRPTDVDYYTQTNHVTDLRIVQVEEEKRSAGVAVYRGWVEVSNTIWGYKKKKRITEEFLGEEILDLPSQTYHTQALWFDIPIWAQDRIMRDHVDFPGGLHAAEHAAIGLLPMFAMCDRADIGGLSTPMHMDTGKPQIFIYDGHPGGVGITEKGSSLYGSSGGPPSTPWKGARANTGARAVYNRRSAATTTSPWTRPRRGTFWRPCWQNET